MSTPDNNPTTPPELQDMERALRTIAQHDRDATPDALIESLSGHVPSTERHAPSIIARLRPVLAIAAALALLITTVLLLKPSAGGDPDSIIDNDLVAVLEDDMAIFDDDFTETLVLLESDLLETEQLLASWDSDQLWEDSQLLWQEVVQ